MICIHTPENTMRHTIKRMTLLLAMLYTQMTTLGHGETSGASTSMPTTPTREATTPTHSPSTVHVPTVSAAAGANAIA